ncbi:hypothetical protein [Erwinia billingiae]|uniref:hypothetical protein n=1 Tax=Erwinia billingiae TaxID=182337 RepID=UPI00224693F9|nr:hypothetical protein [Erwinia billingiae]
MCKFVNDIDNSEGTFCFRLADLFHPLISYTYGLNGKVSIALKHTLPWLAGPLPASALTGHASVMIKTSLFLSTLMLCLLPAMAAMQCGPFHLDRHQDGSVYVNNTKPTQQKVTFTGDKGDYDNVKIHLRVKNTRAPGMLDMDQAVQHGKATLNVQVVRTSASQIRISGSYDCEKVG